jgi:dephospho-CoA kinase
VSRRTERVIGLLGGIGSGKSTVARILAELGAAVIDADRITAECLDDPGIRSRIEAAFGSQVMALNGAVDRKALAKEVFADESRRQELHRIIHPAIFDRMIEELEQVRAADPGGIIVIDAPLLLESRFRQACDILLMIRVPVEKRIERVAATRGWDAEEIERRESFQASTEEKEKAADAVIENAGSLDDLKRRVNAFMNNLKIGRATRPPEKT